MAKLSQRIYCAEQIEVPPSLPELIKKFTKEVIRYNKQRPNLAEFARDYFSASVNGELDAFLNLCESEALADNDQVQVPVPEQSNATNQPPVQSKAATAMLRSVFNVLDRDLNDSLSLAELNAGIEGTPLAEMYTPVFNELLDPNEKVTFESFVSWWAPIPDDQIEKVRESWLVNHFSRKHSPAVVDLLTRLFYKWDTDRSGEMSIDEVVDAMKETTVFGYDLDPVKNAEIRKKNVARIMRSDTNGDGVVSIQEFLAFMDDGIPDEAVPQLIEKLGLQDIENYDWGYAAQEAATTAEYEAEADEGYGGGIEEQGY